MSRIVRVLAVVAIVAAGVEWTPRLLTPFRRTSEHAAQEAREAFDGVFHGTHSDLQLGPLELAYRVHHAEMGEAAMIDLGLERVRRDDAGVVSGNDWALSFSLARAPQEDGNRYLGNLSVKVGDEHPVDVWLDSAHAPTASGECAPDAGPARAC